MANNDARMIFRSAVHVKSPQWEAAVAVSVIPSVATATERGVELGQIRRRVVVLSSRESLIQKRRCHAYRHFFAELDWRRRDGHSGDSRVAEAGWA
jgi:hypothetical protein